MAEWARSTPWRQGSILDQETFREFATGCLNPSQRVDFAVIVSHDCDIAANPAIESIVEAIPGRFMEKEDGSLTHMEFLFLLDDTSLQELTEMRLMMEPALAAKAAERANSQHIALLRQSIVDLEQSKHDRVKLVAADILFHRAIFQASGNRLVGRLFHTIHRAMLNMIMVTSQLVDLEHTLHFHQPILNAIEQRNPELAARLMTDHLNDARDLLLHSRDQEKSRKLRDHLAAGSSLHKLPGKAEPRQSSVRPKAKNNAPQIHP